MSNSTEREVTTGSQSSSSPTTGHTPGPWLLTEDKQAVYALMSNPDERSIRRGHPAEINRFYAGLHCDRACPIAELHANARLIAAAPDLLAACEYLVAWHTPGDLPEGMRGSHFAKRMERARAAIAKAKGEA